MNVKILFLVTDEIVIVPIGVPGILQTYQTCVSQVQLYGPTNFAPIIHHVARFGAAAQREVGAKVRKAGNILPLLEISKKNMDRFIYKDKS